MSDPLHERVVGALGHQYAIECEIGRGGTSVVYRARDIRLNRPVALKVLPPELAYDAAIRMRFAREAQTSAQLQHAHIVPIYDVGERDGIAYLAMSLIGGGNLAEHLAAQPRQPIEEVRRLLCEVADALAYAHLRGVIHRDIKPDNILLDRETGRAMVSDFGIARAVEASTRLTVTGIAVGTPTYMSPEQAVGERQIDGRSDIYSLGVLGYQMLTGRVPFAAGNSMALLLKHVGESPRPLAELRPETPRVLREAIERAMMKAPEDRWPTATALRDALMSSEPAGASWRVEQREPVRYASPRPDSRVASPRRGTASAEARPVHPASSVAPDGIILEPAHLAVFTSAQREDIRLWGGRIHLLDRVKAMRGYALLTLGMWGLATTGVVMAFAEGAVPLVLSPIVPFLMSRKLRRRAQSLRQSGLKVRHVLLMARARWALPQGPAVPSERKLAKLAGREVLESPLGAAVRRAAEDRAAILATLASLPKPDRALLPDVVPTVNGLVERVVHLAKSIHRMDQDLDPRAIAELDARLADMDRESDLPESQQRLALLRRQRATFEDLATRRATLARQLDSAGLALGSLRLDLLKVRSSGVQSALADVTTATQEARALSHDIGVVLDAANEVKRL